MVSKKILFSVMIVGALFQQIETSQDLGEVTRLINDLDSMQFQFLSVARINLMFNARPHLLNAQGGVYLETPLHVLVRRYQNTPVANMRNRAILATLIETLIARGARTDIANSNGNTVDSLEPALINDIRTRLATRPHMPA